MNRYNSALKALPNYNGINYFENIVAKPLPRFTVYMYTFTS